MDAWREKENREQVVLSASQEVRNSIVYATILVAVVFFRYSLCRGLKEDYLSLLGLHTSYLFFASMVVSLTVTPVLSALLLNDKSLAGHEKETKLSRKLKKK